MSATRPQPELPALLLPGGDDAYASDAYWEAPRRNVTWIGRDRVLRGLRLEALAMREAQVTELRRSVGEYRVFNEFSVRFVYAGRGIERVDWREGAEIELERLRILTLDRGVVRRETCIETWTVLRP